MNPIPFNQDTWKKLTAREIEIAQLAAQGLDNKQSAGLLHIAVNSVTSHRTHITQKLGCGSFIQAMVVMAKGGIV